METIRKQNFLIGLYFAVLFGLLLCVSTTPLLIRHGLPLTDRFMIEEEVLETAMIIALFGISFLILIRIANRLRAYRKAVDMALWEKSRLSARLADAFRYIGKVNVEIQEIRTALCRTACHPQNKKELKRFVDHLVTSAMTIAAAPWLVVRMIDRHSGKTVNEHAVRHPGGALPSVTLGNRALLAGETRNGLQTIGYRESSPDFLTVFILPPVPIANEERILLNTILNQIEMLFILYRIGCIESVVHGGKKNTFEEICHDSSQRNPSHAGSLSHSPVD